MGQTEEDIFTNRELDTLTMDHFYKIVRLNINSINTVAAGWI